VVDARGTMRGIAPLLIGYQVFDKEVNIAGVIANMTGGKRHESKLRAAVEEYTDIPFLGALENNPSIGLDERHLGLIPGYEDADSRHKITAISRLVSDNVDLDKLIEIAQQAKPVKPATSPLPQKLEYIFTIPAILRLFTRRVRNWFQSTPVGIRHYRQSMVFSSAAAFPSATPPPCRQTTDCVNR